MPSLSVCVAGLFIVSGAMTQGAGVSLDSPRSARMAFYCNTGYSQEACQAQVARLQQQLRKIDLEALGDWSWVLVRSDDWCRILRRAGRDPDSPAFTILERRQTFLEEALFRPMAGRSRTLLEKWRVPLDELLNVAVTHELAHALCRERDEARTHGYAGQLSESGQVTCGVGTGR